MLTCWMLLVFCRYIIEGRVSMASPQNHQLLEILQQKQIVMEEAVAGAAAAVRELSTRARQQGNWQTNEDFGAGAEVNAAVELYYESQGAEVDVLPMLKSIVGPDGKDAYSFDGVFEVAFGQQKLLVLVETKHRLGAGDVGTLVGKRNALMELLTAVKNGAAANAGYRRSYSMQLKMLQELCSHEVRLAVGGQSVGEEGRAAAANANCLLVQPSGGRYSVVLPEL